MSRRIETLIKDSSLVKEKRKQILDGALNVFKEKGFHKATMRAIARESGVTIGSLYDYIEKKEDILFLAHEEAAGRIQSQIRDCMEKEGDLLTRFSNGIKLGIKLHWEYRNEIVLMYREVAELSPEDRAIIYDMERSLITLYEEILKQGMAEGVFRETNAFILANAFTLIFATVALKRWNLREHSPEELSEVLVDFIVSSLIKREKG